MPTSVRALQMVIDSIQKGRVQAGERNDQNVFGIVRNKNAARTKHRCRVAAVTCRELMVESGNWAVSFVIVHSIHS